MWNTNPWRKGIPRSTGRRRAARPRVLLHAEPPQELRERDALPFLELEEHADGAQLQVAKLITLRALSVLRVRAGCPQEQKSGEQ